MAGGCRNCDRRFSHHCHCQPRQHPKGHGGGPCHRVQGVMMVVDRSMAVRCSGVTKSFPAGDGHVEVLHEINFEVPAGELTMLVGPSGCGKTTLISIIAGILSATAGTVETCGKLITQMSDTRRR